MKTIKFFAWSAYSIMMLIAMIILYYPVVHLEEFCPVNLVGSWDIQLCFFMLYVFTAIILSLVFSNTAKFLDDKFKTIKNND